MDPNAEVSSWGYSLLIATIIVLKKSFLTRINRIYYWRSFFTTQHYCLQLNSLIKKETYMQKIIKKVHIN